MIGLWSESVGSGWGIRLGEDWTLGIGTGDRISWTTINDILSSVELWSLTIMWGGETWGKGRLSIEIRVWGDVFENKLLKGNEFSWNTISVEKLTLPNLLKALIASMLRWYTQIDTFLIHEIKFMFVIGVSKRKTSTTNYFDWHKTR